MRGTWQTTGGGAGLVGAAAVAAVVVLVLEFLTDLLIIAGTVVGAMLAIVTVMAVRMRRAGRLSLSPVVAWEPNAVRPVSPAAPVTARPAAALPGPQTVHNYFFYGVTAEQVADVAARQRALTERETDGRIRQGRSH